MKTLVIGAVIIIVGMFILLLTFGEQMKSDASKPSCGKYQQEPGPGGWLVMPHGEGSAGVEKLRFASVCKRRGLQPIMVTDQENLMVCSQGDLGLNFLFTHNALMGTRVQGLVMEKGVDVTCRESARLYEIAESVQFNYAK